MSSAGVATGLVRRMIETESRGWGDTEGAMRRLSARYGLPYWSLNNLRTGRAKTVEAGLFLRIKQTFADQCARQAARLLHEAELAKAVGPNNDDVADITDKIRALVAELEAAKGETKGETVT